MNSILFVCLSVLVVILCVSGVMLLIDILLLLCGDMMVGSFGLICRLLSVGNESRVM